MSFPPTQSKPMEGTPMGQTGPSMSPLPEYVQAQQGFQAAGKKAHRGRRSRGKGPKAHHADAKAHMATAQSAPTPVAAMPHLFKAIRSLHAAKAADPVATDTLP